MHKMESKNINNIIAVLAVVVVVVAVINLYITFMKVSEFEKTLTGYATGYVNITIASSISLNITNSSADFGAGGVNSTCNRAMLYTNGKSPPIIVCGNWSTNPTGGAYPHGIVIENNGNVNCTLTVTGGTDAATMIGGAAGGGPTYNWNVTTSEAGSCSGNAIGFNVWNTANTTPKILCTDFSPAEGGDEVTIDVNITVPFDATTGAKSDTINIVATAQG